MQFKAKIENLGKIDTINVDIKPLTILVGKNSTGKSFITKSLYCILNTLNKNLLHIKLSKLVETIDVYIYEIYSSLSQKRNYDKEILLFIKEEYIPFLLSIVEEIKDKDLIFAEKIIKENKKDFLTLNKKLENYIKRKEKLMELSQRTKYILRFLSKNVENLKSIFDNIRNFLLSQIQKTLEENFKHNFQQKNLENLVKFGEPKSRIDLEGIGTVEINLRGDINFDFYPRGIEIIGNLKNIIYIDSPVYLKIRKGIKKETPFFAKGRFLKGYPQYIDELYNFLEIQTIEKNEDNFLQISKEIQKIVGGKFTIDEIGDLNFLEKEKEIQLSLLAMGTSNLALLEYLIRNNIISKGSFLIIDEPESHLHPSWQVKLTEILYKIAESGANVIIATHSMNILKALEFIVKNNKDASKIISINKLPYNKKFEKFTFEEKIEEALKELIHPYNELIWKTL